MISVDKSVYMRARYYDPETGRFLSEDPAGLDAGVNLYAYAGGNPVAFIDPIGLAWFRPDNHEYLVGRRDNPMVTPGYNRGGFLDGGYLDDYLPAGHTFASMHDPLVGWLTSLGVPDWLANVPTMPVTYAVAVVRETVNSVAKLFGIDAFEHRLAEDISPSIPLSIPFQALPLQTSTIGRSGCVRKCF